MARSTHDARPAVWTSLSYVSRFAVSDAQGLDSLYLFFKIDLTAVIIKSAADMVAMKPRLTFLKKRTENRSPDGVGRKDGKSGSVGNAQLANKEPAAYTANVVPVVRKQRD